MFRVSYSVICATQLACGVLLKMKKYFEVTEAVVQWCSVKKKGILRNLKKIYKIHRKTPVPESLF